MNNKLLSLLGLCKRAGKLIQGFDAVETAVKDKTAGLVLLSRDLSPKTAKSIAHVCEGCGAKWIRLHASMEDVYRATGKHTGVMGVADWSFAKKICELVSNGEESL
jgi:ribosomal protein L7Ae-like RNA K-turn-binding protein